MCAYSRRASQIQVSVAEHNLLGADSQQTKLFRVNQIVMHPSYVTRQLADDIALINLDGDVQWSDRVQPACLPNPDEDSFAGLLATVAGWGWVDEVKNGIASVSRTLVICSFYIVIHCRNVRWKKGQHSAKS